MLTGILSQEQVHLNLFTARDNEKEKLLMTAIDKINGNFGRYKIRVDSGYV